MNLTDKENINKELEILENAAISNSNEDTHSMVLAYLLLNEPDFLEVIFNKMGLNTSDNKVYQPGDNVRVIYGMHFIAQYNEK